MCETNGSLKLCTCKPNEQVPITHNKNSRRHKKSVIQNNATGVVWILERKAQQHSPNFYEIEGSVIPSVTQLGKELTATYIEQELNRQNCFDFEFEPQEGDVVSFRFNELLSKRDDQSYMSFEYSHGHWEIRPFHPFTFSESKEIGAGKVDIIDK